MLVSVYQNNLQIPILSYQQKLFLPRIYSCNLGDTILHFLNKKELPFSDDFFETTQLEKLHKMLFESVHNLRRDHFTHSNAIPILYKSKKQKLSFSIHYEYEASVGFIQVYEINTLQEALAVELIEYQKLVECDVLPPLKICPQCQTCFTSKRIDALYCSQNCVEKNFKKEKKKDVYYKKYRSLQQYYNKKMNLWCQRNPSSTELYKKQYTLWQILSKKEYEKLAELKREDLPEVADFVKKLKGYWTISAAKTKL